MKFSEMLDQIPAGGRRVFGEPVETPDGATVITAARVRSNRAGGAVGTPLGAFVVRGETARWVPAVDADRIALIGVLTGLVAALLGSLAVLRRPPWPDLRQTHPER